jgi:hypothetical protein
MFFLGLFIGASVATIVIVLCQAAGRADENMGIK